MTLDLIMKKLENELDESRFRHSVNVMETSLSLAKHYGVDFEKAKLAGILHDCGKNYKGDAARQFVQQIGYQPDEIEMAQPRLLHGVIGEYIAKVEYDVKDEDVLNSIRWHTTGRAHMSLLEKIIYVADYIEPLRKFKGIELMRKSAYENINYCVLLCSESTIRYILDKGVYLHEKTVETRNCSLMLLSKRN